MTTPLHAPAHAWGSFADDTSALPVLEAALAAASGASLAEARIVEAEEMRLYTVGRGGFDERTETNAGIGVRVLVDGAWGFASVAFGVLDPIAAARLAAGRAVRSARAAAGLATIELQARLPSSGTWAVPVAVDPFAVSAADRTSLLEQVVAAATAPTAVRSVSAGLNAKRQHKHFADLDGSRQHQHLMETGGMLQVLAADEDGVARRSYPNSFHGNTMAGGWETIAALELVHEADRVGREAVELLTAPHAPVGRADVVIGPAQMALQIHESVGHALELDRILGDEANFAGRSWVQAADIGTLRYGSDAVTIVADPTAPGTRGTFAWDDEGTPAERRVLIDHGTVVEALSTRDAAARVGRTTSGAARADGWSVLPVAFATNVFLEPGTGSLDELLDLMGDGFMIDDNRSWSIDDRRMDFQFGTEVAWEVTNGRRGQLLKGFSYGGRTPDFWRSVEATAGPEEFRAFGMPCGKGEPKQWGFLGHGAAPTLVRDLAIGVQG